MSALRPLAAAAFGRDGCRRLFPLPRERVAAGPGEGTWIGVPLPASPNAHPPTTLPGETRETRDRGRSRIQHRHHAAFRQRVAHLDLQLLDHARHRRGHFQRGLVRFQRDQALVLLHRVADRDQHFDDRDVAVVADVGDLDFDRRHASRWVGVRGAAVRVVQGPRPSRDVIPAQAGIHFPCVAGPSLIASMGRCGRAWDALLQQQAADVAQLCREIGGEARGVGAVDDAVVVASATAAASGAARSPCRSTPA